MRHGWVFPGGALHNGVKTVYETRQAGAATLEDQAQAEEDATFADAAEAEGEAAPEPPDCKGQNHHVISRPIAKALERGMPRVVPDVATPLACGRGCHRTASLWNAMARAWVTSSMDLGIMSSSPSEWRSPFGRKA